MARIDQRCCSTPTRWATPPIGDDLHPGEPPRPLRRPPALLDRPRPCPGDDAVAALADDQLGRCGADLAAPADPHRPPVGVEQLDRDRLAGARPSVTASGRPRPRALTTVEPVGRIVEIDRDCRHQPVALGRQPTALPDRHRDRLLAGQAGEPHHGPGGILVGLRAPAPQARSGSRRRCAPRRARAAPARHRRSAHPAAPPNLRAASAPARRSPSPRARGRGTTPVRCARRARSRP